MREPTIVINGTTLTTAQALTLRVAVGIFQIDLQARREDARGTAEYGPTEEAYEQRLAEIARIMHFGTMHLSDDLAQLLVRLDNAARVGYDVSLTPESCDRLAAVLRQLPAPAP